MFFASIFFNEWHSNTSEAVIELPSEKLNIELNLKFGIEQGYQMFIIRTDNHENDIYIAAKSLNYNTDTVYYYNRENLKSNERLADFVKNIK